MVEEHQKEVVVVLLFTVDHQVVHQQGAGAVPVLRHIVGAEVEAEVRMQHQRKLEVGVLRCLEVAGVLRRQYLAVAVPLAVGVCLPLEVVVQVSEAAVGVVLQAAAVAEVFHRHLATVLVARRCRSEVLVHLPFMTATKLILCKLQQLGMIIKYYCDFLNKVYR